ncbi:hypothetical protein GBF38_007754, partial [Nibea albiflora]
VVQRRSMSSVPGGSGENIVYALLCGGAFVGAVSYAVKTVNDDGIRFNGRVAEIKARPKSEWKPKPWPPKGKYSYILLRCNAKAKVLCGRMDIHPRTGLFGSERENKPSLSSFPPLHLSCTAKERVLY